MKVKGQKVEGRRKEGPRWAMYATNGRVYKESTILKKNTTGEETGLLRRHSEYSSSSQARALSPRLALPLLTCNTLPNPLYYRHEERIGHHPYIRREG